MSLQTRFFVVFCLGVLSSYACGLATMGDTIDIPWAILGLIGGFVAARVARRAGKGGDEPWRA